MDEVDSVIREYGLSAEGLPCWKAAKDMKLYIVENTSKKVVYVVASCVRCARFLALWGNHIKAFDNGTVFTVKNEWLEADAPFQSALRRAVKEGFPGIIQRIGDAAVILPNFRSGISGKVHQPISSIQNA